MNKLIEKILFKFGYMPIEKHYEKINALNDWWKKVILDPLQLSIQQAAVRNEIRMIKAMEYALFHGSSKPRKMQGVKKFIERKVK